MTRAHDLGGFSFELSDSAPDVASEERTPMGDLDLDLNDFGPGLELSSHAPAVESADPHEGATQAAAWSRSPFSPLAPDADAAPLPDAPDEDEPVLEFGERQTQPVLSGPPLIKKISFPAPQKKTARKTAAQSKRPTTATTRFSASISQRAPEVDRDSEQSMQATPEDLPDCAQAVPDTKQLRQWDSETPTAREIWHSARRVWQSTSHQAVTWSGQGLLSAQKLARNVNHRLRARLDEAAQQRKLKWEQQHESAPVAQSQAPQARTTSAPQTSASQTSAPQTSAPQTSAPQWGSPASGVALRRAYSSLKKAAAPAAALAAAAAVYFAGTQLLGTSLAPSLSRSTQTGPSIPDLGTLPNSVERKKSSDASDRLGAPTAPTSGTNKPASTLAPLQTELAPMPEGLSWPGKGLIEVVTSEDELIYIDGVFTGRGPLRRIPVTPGKHHVAIKTGGEERTGTVDVVADKNTRAIFKGSSSP